MIEYRLPYHGEAAFDQADDSEGDHGCRKDRMTHACDAHCSILRSKTNGVRLMKPSYWLVPVDAWQAGEEFGPPP
ncbi:hypothetical protein GCM10008098_00290 [Rhodanobacter panaciterrae]|uniref:Uncharacterized protein n=1 Tax=Rhodanobacter panaciterrae TaxID=490572 RepID=A0ABQ2ZFT7_9GAMM|nr:hypothetical protein GCM10008098_00290 [Rhodanobacter panaciterrae]